MVKLVDRDGLLILLIRSLSVMLKGSLTSGSLSLTTSCLGPDHGPPQFKPNQVYGHRRCLPGALLRHPEESASICCLS